MKCAVLAAAAVVLCGACASATRVTTGPASTGPASTGPTSTGPASTGPEPVAPVIRLSYEGGFVPAGAAFTNTATLVVTGDGTVYSPAPVTQQYPGKLVNPVLLGKLDAATVTRLIDGARQANLLRSVKYTPNNRVADAPDTVLELTVNGTTYVHRANALGLGNGPTDVDRKAFATYVQSLQALELAGSVPTPPTQLAIRAVPSKDAGEPPTAGAPIAWPETAGTRLADASTCKLVAFDAVRVALEHATQLSHFTDRGVDYSLYARPILPGDHC